jgi:hypothetical protein
MTPRTIDGYEFITTQQAKFDTGHPVMDIVAIIYDKFKDKLIKTNLYTSNWYEYQIDRDAVIKDEFWHFTVLIFKHQKKIVEYLIIQEYGFEDFEWYNHLNKKVYDEKEEKEFLFYLKLLS